jgi:hypothetical protein
MTAGMPPRPTGRRCPSCGRFTSWRQIRYCWRSDCCKADVDEGERGPMVIEHVAEWTAPDGQRFLIAVSRPDIKPATITRSPSP